ncbi:TIGR03943 family protein [Corynebacterium sp. HMSC05E07]|uniref:TIGR03943 family putative permease subunit n=1 Tax=Corynebacterium sp. HMSC05E07 TaxID=1581117 RepID=UPI0008B85F14|nr:TIGR03943 family protein [Corynebacterium sp. HMSC05E07]OFT63601.1 hypothetical protein HMPREF3149_00685 [Corynebacterium sp. HMSC05E07]
MGEVRVRQCGVVLVGLFALGLVWLVAVGDVARYLAPRFSWLLIAAGVVLFGAAIVARADRSVPRMAWLLLVPLALVWLAQPHQLGSTVAQNHAGARQPAASELRGKSAFAPLGETAGIRELNVRAHLEPENIAGKKVTVRGFAVRAEDGWHLTRFTISCCAADAMAYAVRLDTNAALSEDAWYEVTGAVSPGQEPVLAVAASRDISAIGVPEDPYEH